MSESICRWGVLGAADILRRNWHAFLGAENAQLVAVASRKIEAAEKLIAECQACVPHPVPPRAVAGYEAILAAPDIDAVYIPLPTGLRKEWVIRAAQAGKHVLAEKPCGCTAKDVEEMIVACRAHKVQFMDGVMFMHCHRLRRLRDILNDPANVGEVRRITSEFSFMGGGDFMNANIRTNAALEPLGCLGDLGWYNIRFALWVMNWKMPKAVRGSMLSSASRDGGNGADAVPTELSGELYFDNGVSGAFYTSFITANQEWARVSGTTGNLEIPDFVLPFSGDHARYTIRNTEFVTEGCRSYMEERADEQAVAEGGDTGVEAQEVMLFKNFSELVLSGKLDDHWPKISLLTQRVMDAVLASARQGGQLVRLE